MSSYVKAMAIAFGFAVAATAGCGGDPTGTVNGTVILEGKLLTSGSVSVIVNGVPYSSDIRNGQYAAGPMPVGDAVVLVFDPPIDGATMQLDKEELEALRLAKKAPPPPKQKPAIVPKRYGEIATSTIKLTVLPGSNTLDIVLTKN